MEDKEINRLNKELLQIYRERDAWRELSKTQDTLLACYRCGAGPKINLATDKMEKARDFVKQLQK